MCKLSFNGVVLKNVKNSTKRNISEIKDKKYLIASVFVLCCSFSRCSHLDISNFAFYMSFICLQTHSSLKGISKVLMHFSTHCLESYLATC